jgi:UDP-N-acetylglucosamine:LPS N-acetylglucosamine transferase
MRIVMTSNAGGGHLGPLFPFAKAFLRAGDEVLLAAPAQERRAVERADVPFHALPDPPQDELDAIYAAVRPLSNDDAGFRVMREVFAGIKLRASLPALVRLLADHRPDVVLREPTE